MGEGFVYFMLTENSKYVKIGYAQDPKRRLKEIQTGSPFRLYIVGLVKGNILTETKLHQQFHQHRKVGEWFNYHDDISHFIKNECPYPENISIPLEDYNYIIRTMAEAEAQLSTSYYVAPDGTVCNQNSFLHPDRGKEKLDILITKLHQTHKLLLKAAQGKWTT